MSRVTTANVFKAVAALFFSIFVAFYVLIIGLSARNKKVIMEGAAYAVIFIVAFSVDSGGGPGAFLGLGSMAVAAVRSFQLRDLWLPRKAAPAPVQWVQNQAPTLAHRVEVQAPPPWNQEQWQSTMPVPQPKTQEQWQPPVAMSASQPAPLLSADDLSSALQWVSSNAKQNKHRLPAEAYVSVLEICQTLDATIDEERRKPTSDAGFEYELEALIREYLPAVLKGYLAVSPSLVFTRQPNGRTANEELIEQLDLLGGQADALHSTRTGHTSAELSSTGNFLRERFGHQKRSGFDFGIE